jgi:hypothetical protein
MSNPRETVIEAHGGPGRGSRLDAVSARLVQDGARRAVPGPQGVLAAPPQRDLNGAPPWES